jgi:AAA family ATPase
VADHQTEGCSGAEIASICQDAALTAMNEDLKAEYVSDSFFFANTSQG